MGDLVSAVFFILRVLAWCGTVNTFRVSICTDFEVSYFNLISAMRSCGKSKTFSS